MSKLKERIKVISLFLATKGVPKLHIKHKRNCYCYYNSFQFRLHIFLALLGLLLPGVITVVEFESEVSEIQYIFPFE